MGSFTGTVDASQPFKAAQVFIRHVDRRVWYLVYTHVGPFRAVALLPGNDDVTVQARGLESDVHQLAIQAGDQPNLKVSVREAAHPNPCPSAVYTPPGVAVTLQRDDEMYPPGPGTPVMDDVCLVCHGEHVFPMRPRHDAGWQAAIDLMTGTHLCDRDRIARPKASSLRSLRVFVSAIRTIRRARRRDQALRGRPPAESGAIGPSARAGAVGDIHAPRRRWLSSTADDARV